MILALLACAPADPSLPGDAAPAEPTPGAGAFAVTVAEEWEGDCDFEDPATYQDPEQDWMFDPRGDVLILYKTFWEPLSCELSGVDFVCDDGSWESGRMQVTLLVEGTFPTEATVEGALVVELDCGGAGCDSLQDLYGRRLDFPCRSEAPFEGAVE